MLDKLHELHSHFLPIAQRRPSIITSSCWKSTVSDLTASGVDRKKGCLESHLFACSDNKKFIWFQNERICSCAYISKYVVMISTSKSIVFVLVHLSRGLKCTIVITRCPSSVICPSSVCPASVRRNLSHFRLHLWNRWTEFNETFQEARSTPGFTPLLPTWIYSCRSRVKVSCALPFTTNVTISISISQTE